MYFSLKRINTAVFCREKLVLSRDDYRSFLNMILVSLNLLIFIFCIMYRLSCGFSVLKMLCLYPNLLVS